MTPRERREAYGEIAAVAVTGAAFQLARRLLDAKLLFIVPCVLAWVAYIAWRVRRDPTALRRWGVRRDNLAQASVVPFAMTAVVALAIALYRVARGFRPLPPVAALLFLAYPVWAFFQQLFVQSLVAGNLSRLGVDRRWVVPVVAVLFGLVHLPELDLVVLCTLAGLVWTACFVTRPNLVPLAVCHGWLGVLAYYWLLERDPLHFRV